MRAQYAPNACMKEKSEFKFVKKAENVVKDVTSIAFPACAHVALNRCTVSTDFVSYSFQMSRNTKQSSAPMPMIMIKTNKCRTLI